MRCAWVYCSQWGLSLCALMGLAGVTFMGVNMAWFGVGYLVSLVVILNHQYFNENQISDRLFPFAATLFVVSGIVATNLTTWGVVWLLATLLWVRVQVS